MEVLADVSIAGVEAMNFRIVIPPSMITLRHGRSYRKETR